MHGALAFQYYTTSWLYYHCEPNEGNVLRHSFRRRVVWTGCRRGFSPIWRTHTVSRHSLLPRCGNSYGHKNMKKILKNFTGSRVLSPVTYSHDGTIYLRSHSAIRPSSSPTPEPRCFTRDVDLPRSCVSFYTGWLF